MYACKDTVRTVLVQVLDIAPGQSLARARVANKRAINELDGFHLAIHCSRNMAFVYCYAAYCLHNTDINSHNFNKLYSTSSSLLTYAKCRKHC